MDFWHPDLPDLHDQNCRKSQLCWFFPPDSIPCYQCYPRFSMQFCMQFSMILQVSDSIPVVITIFSQDFLRVFPMFSIIFYINGHFRNLNWRYLPYIRSKIQAYVSGNITTKYGQEYGTFTYLHLLDPGDLPLSRGLHPS